MKLKKGEFVGRDALVAQKDAGRHAEARRLHDGRAQLPAARLSGFYDGAPSGEVCSGTMSPTLGIPIGTATSRPPARRKARPSRSRSAASALPATVVKPPFYKDASHL